MTDDQSLDNILVARGFARFTVTIRAADRAQAERIAEAAAGLVRAEFSAITSDVVAYPRGKCSDHKPVQHRDRKRPWCNRCGRAADGELIGTPR